MSSVQSLSCVHCNPMDCSMPGFPVYHQLLELTQTHVHLVGDAIQPSHPLSSPSPPAFNLSQQQGLYKWYHIFVFLCLVYVHCYVHSSTILNSKTHKQPNPLTGEWIKKMWHIYTMEYYSAIKRMNPGVGKDSILAWKIPWTVEPGGLQSMELQRIGHDFTLTQKKQWNKWNNAICSKMDEPYHAVWSTHDF